LELCTANKIIIQIKRGYVAYSAILIKFIAPLLNGQEEEQEYLSKACMGMITPTYQKSIKKLCNVRKNI